MAKAKRISRRPPPPPVEKLWTLELDPKEMFVLVQLLKLRAATLRRFIAHSRVKAFGIRARTHLSHVESILDAITAGKNEPITEETL